MQKLSHLSGSEWIEHSHSPIFTVTHAGNVARLVSAAPNGEAEPFERLVQCLVPPYFLLYVLHTPRGDGAAGRYQSPEIDGKQLRDLMAKFKSYLSADSRFDLWVHSPAERATVVWDRHNLLFGYGPVENFSAELRALGFSDGEPEIPSLTNITTERNSITRPNRFCQRCSGAIRHYSRMMSNDAEV